MSRNSTSLWPFLLVQRVGTMQMPRSQKKASFGAKGYKDLSSSIALSTSPLSVVLYFLFSFHFNFKLWTSKHAFVGKIIQLFMRKKPLKRLSDCVNWYLRKVVTYFFECFGIFGVLKCMKRNFISPTRTLRTRVSCLVGRPSESRYLVQVEVEPHNIQS